MEGQLLGRVAWFNEAKGYGELLTEDQKVFFFTYRELHPTKRHRTIRRNTLVFFSLSNRTVFGTPVADRVTEMKVKLDLGTSTTRTPPEVDV